jgi:hypothetical protein
MTCKTAASSRLNEIAAELDQLAHAAADGLAAHRARQQAVAELQAEIRDIAMSLTQEQI